ncbi:hypothetical protein AOQ84DRAFT_305295, partial [Glonium stellatum]
IDEANTDNKVFKIAKWRKNTTRVQPLLLEGIEEETPDKQITELLRERIEIAEEPKERPGQRQVGFERLTRREVRQATIEVKTTTQGPDGTTVPGLKTIWDKEGDTITDLFNGYVQEGNHLFKDSTIALLLKQGRNQTTVKGWRPIALLSVLGKGLERAMAHRLC